MKTVTSLDLVGESRYLEYCEQISTFSYSTVCVIRGLLYQKLSEIITFILYYLPIVLLQVVDLKEGQSSFSMKLFVI